MALKNLVFRFAKTSAQLSLTFELKSELVERVSTGHLGGCITISLREADDVEREKARVEFAEPQRTLVGHFRHELGQYFWDLLVKPNRLEAFRDVFGDETNPSCTQAHERHYSEGPPADWRSRSISAYASMHPWEDFAESFGPCPDMAAVLSTAGHFNLMTCDLADFNGMIGAYRQVGIAANYYGITDQGRKRKSNQDQFLVARLQKSMLVDHASLSEVDRKRFSSDADGRLLLVADGMGGHAGGELASELVINGAAEYVLSTIPWFYRLNQSCDEDFEEELKP